MKLMDEHGADSVRWALFTGTVPGQSTRFSDEAPVDALKEFLLKLWNVYSFFVTYATIDGWSPENAKDAPAVADRPDMDRWILAELDSAVRDVRSALDGYTSHLAARRLAALGDSLSNWYVRRSRSRFWAEGDDPDKRAAFATLYEVLVSFAKLLAPFTPFLSETLYQNLVRKGDPSAHESVHLAAFPEPDDARVDDALREHMEIARGVVGLGQRVRTEQKLKVRQPLARAILVIASDAGRAAIERFDDAIREELNVHALELVEQAGEYVEVSLVPNFRALGPKLGKRMKACKKALAEADGAALKAALDDHGEATLAMPDGDPIRLGPDEIEVRFSAKEDFAAAAERGRVVILDTHLDDALRREGMAREVVNRIQRARKAADLAFDDRIALRYRAEGELAEALREHAERIAGEVLATSFEAGDSLEGADAQETDVEGEPLSFWLRVQPKP
jgi:isoleucyl-tRNA synthetase